MKLVKKITLEQTETFNNSDLCIATEYDFKDKDIDISTALIKGRYPDEGYCVNTEVKEMIYVISGGGQSSLKTELYQSLGQPSNISL